MRLDNFIEGLEILKKHVKGLEWADVRGEHDLVVVTSINVASCTAEEISRLSFLGFFPGQDGEMLECDICQVLAETGMPIEEDQDFEWSDLTDAQWEVLKDCYCSDCFTYYS